MSLKNLSSIHAVHRMGFEHKQRTPKIVQIAEINKNATRELHYSKPSSGY